MNLLKVKQYREDKSINYSTLKALAEHPFKAKQIIDGKKIKADETSLSYGSVFDCLLTTPEEFDNEFLVSDLTLTDTESELFNHLYKNNLDFESQNLYDISLQLNLWSNISKKETRLKKIDTILKQLKNYKSIKYNANTRSIITTEMYNKALEAKYIIQNHEFTSRFFDEKRYTIIYQVPIYFTHLGHKCKVLVDMLVIDNLDRVVYQIDIKTLSSYTLYFPSNFREYKYYLQACLYHEGIKFYLVENGLSNYRIEILYLCSSSTDINHPLVFRLSEKDRIKYMNDFTSRLGVPMKGLNTLIEELSWHITNNIWDYPFEVYKQRGILTLEPL